MPLDSLPFLLRCIFVVYGAEEKRSFDIQKLRYQSLSFCLSSYSANPTAFGQTPHRLGEPHNVWANPTSFGQIPHRSGEFVIRPQRV